MERVGRHNSREQDYRQLAREAEREREREGGGVGRGRVCCRQTQLQGAGLQAAGQRSREGGGGGRVCGGGWVQAHTAPKSCQEEREGER